MVKRANAALAAPHAVAYSVIHASSGRGEMHSDCWYPPPTTPACNCAATLGACLDRSPGLLSSIREYRYRPQWPLTLPDDTDYGTAAILCLSPDMYEGREATKLRAVEAYQTQQGFAALAGDVPDQRRGLIDCSGYNLSFVRKTEAYAVELPEPVPPATPTLQEEQTR
jgi:hypothetical protein